MIAMAAALRVRQDLEHADAETRTASAQSKLEQPARSFAGCRRCKAPLAAPFA